MGSELALGGIESQPRAGGWLQPSRHHDCLEKPCMITDAEKEAVRRSWKLVVPIGETAADLFYKRLFELRPDYRKLFPDDLAAQKRKLLQMLAFIVKSLTWPDAAWRDDIPIDEDLLLVVLALGRRHSELYSIPAESYATVGEALVWTLDYGLGDAFTAEVRDAWLHVYTLLSKTMLMGPLMIDKDSAHSRQQAAALAEQALRNDREKQGLLDAELFVEHGSHGNN
jgi:hemoglobin-like flavoprotein